jgi:transcriptional regulator of arginine metabolism
MKRRRQQTILEIVSDKLIATQEELAAELEVRGMQSTQSSVSRDISELGLVKANGYYTAPKVDTDGQIVHIETAGENLIVVKTGIGEAQPTAITIDRAEIPEIVGTLAGDDTIFIAVKSEASQRLAIRRIVELFSPTPFALRTRAAGRPRLARPAAQVRSGRVGRATLARSSGRRRAQ